MSLKDHQELLNAIQSLNTEELKELIEEYNRVFGLRTPAAASDTEELHIFSSVVQYVPTLYYDGGRSAAVWIDDPGNDTDAFVALMKDVIDPSFSVSDMLNMRRLCHRGKSFKFELDEDYFDVYSRLKTSGASFAWEEDDVAEHKEVKLCSLPKGFEEKLYHTIAMTKGEPLAKTMEYTVYVYRVPVNDARREPCAPDYTFVFLNTETDKYGHLYRKALSCLDKDAVRELKRKGAISFEYEPETPYHVRIGSGARQGFRHAPDLRALEDEILIKFWPDHKHDAILWYRKKTGEGLHEAKYAVECLFDSFRDDPVYFEE